MILRRPYALLIKHFRLIHLIMFGLIIYNIMYARNILNFFKDYIAYNGNIEVLSSKYINYYIFICFFFLIIFSIIIYFLMKYKNKPKLFYVGVIITSLISSVLFIYLYNNIKSLETITLTGREIRLLRDLSQINFWFLIIDAIPIIIRGLGFDIKKFNFTSDLKELNLSSEDSEEVELSPIISSNNVKRSGRKVLRELGYYYKDNKLIINILIIFIVILLILIYPFNRYVINSDLSEGSILSTNSFNIKVNSSYISERNRISKNNSFVILKVSIIGKISKYSLDLDDITLRGKNNNYKPSLKFYNYFKDIGTGYRDYTLSTSEYEDYILIFNIDNSDKDSTLKLKYIQNEQLIKLNPKILD